MRGDGKTVSFNTANSINGRQFREANGAKTEKDLILGASRLQLPGILKAKEMGLYVGVVDQDPLAVGIDYADEFYEVSTMMKSVLLKLQRFPS